MNALECAKSMERSVVMHNALVTYYRNVEAYTRPQLNFIVWKPCNAEAFRRLSNEVSKAYSEYWTDQAFFNKLEVMGVHDKMNRLAKYLEVNNLVTEYPHATMGAIVILLARELCRKVCGWPAMPAL